LYANTDSYPDCVGHSHTYSDSDCNRYANGHTNAKYNPASYSYTKISADSTSAAVGTPEVRSDW
jgi:hypothetical protein